METDPDMAGDREFDRTNPDPLPREAAPGCPDDNVLAAFADGNVLPGERERWEPHLAACGPCRETVARLSRPGDSEAVVAQLAPSATQRPAPRLRLREFAAAAAVLAVAGTAFWYSRPAPDSDAVLLAASSELAREHPDLFREFAPLSRAERLALGDEAHRGGTAALLPAGVVGETRPEFRWEGAEEIVEWTIALRRQEDGSVLWRTTRKGTSAAYPSGEAPLSRGGSYLWEVSGDGPAGSVRDQRPFTVATEGEQAAYAASLRAIDASFASARVGPLLKAQLALRVRRAADAERFAREALAAAPGDSVARQTLLRALTVLGSAEAERMRLEER